MARDPNPAAIMDDASSPAPGRAELERQLAHCQAELEGARKQLESFSYSVSHDLRAPLRAIEGFTRILTEDYGPQLDAEAQRHLTTIVAATRAMGSLIDDLLSLSRVDRQEFHRARIDMSVLVQETWQRLPGRKSSIDFVLHPLPPAWGDHAMVRQLTTHLLENAVQATQNQSRPKIEFSGKASGGSALYSVADNGVGFDMKYADRLFSVFQKLHGKEVFEGNGIGLALAQRIVQRHGGKISAQATANQGATFSFTLPAAP